MCIHIYILQIYEGNLQVKFLIMTSRAQIYMESGKNVSQSALVLASLPWPLYSFFFFLSPQDLFSSDVLRTCEQIRIILTTFY